MCDRTLILSKGNSGRNWEKRDTSEFWNSKGKGRKIEGPTGNPRWPEVDSKAPCSPCDFWKSVPFLSLIGVYIKEGLGPVLGWASFCWAWARISFLSEVFKGIISTCMWVIDRFEHVIYKWLELIVSSVLVFCLYIFFGCINSDECSVGLRYITSVNCPGIIYNGVTWLLFRGIGFRLTFYDPDESL